MLGGGGLIAFYCPGIGGGGIIPCGGGCMLGGGGPLIGAGPLTGMPGAPIPTPLPGPARPPGACYMIGATCIDLPIGCALPMPAIAADSPTRLPA